jgi:thiol-disulfide isomerase/thioredoxin
MTDANDRADGSSGGAQGGSAAVAAPGGPGLIRSLVHRLGGDPLALPDEGRLAPFTGASGWLNSEPLTPEGLRGRVVLLDFWTYTCINWLRTAPYLRAWDAKYRDAGLTIVGVHTPEFGFERTVENIVAESRRYPVDYPIAIDSDYGVWEAFANHYWPAVYLVDAEGRIRFHHFGEGEYAMTEMAIQQLLLDAGAEGIDQELVSVAPRGLEVAAEWRNVRSPESYLGWGQATGFVSDDAAAYDRSRAYTAPDRLWLNTWGLTGQWTAARHAAILDAPGGRLAFQFHARDVNLVMGPASRGAAIPFRLFLDGEPATGAAGTDANADATGALREQRTYQLIRQPGQVFEHRFEIEFLEAGAETYCFTFG